MLDISTITEEEAREELKKIAYEMQKADEAYYQKDDPYLTDAAYDELFDKVSKHYILKTNKTVLEKPILFQRDLYIREHILQ